LDNYNPKNLIVGIAAAISVVFFWSAWVVISRFGVTNSLTIYDLAGFRFGVGAVIALPYIIWRKTWQGLTIPRMLVLTVTAGIPYALLAYAGFVYAPAAHGGVFMNGSLPIFTALFGWIWTGQRSHSSQIAGMGLILTGVVLVGYDGIVSSGSSATLLGDVLFLSAIILFAVFMVANKVWQITPGQVLFSVTLVSAIIYTPIWMLHLESNLAAAPIREIFLQAAYQGLIPSVIGISFLNIAVHHIGADKTSAFISAVPVLAALLAIPFLGEMPGYQAWLGMVMVTAGILLAIGLFVKNQ